MIHRNAPTAALVLAAMFASPAAAELRGGYAGACNFQGYPVPFELYYTRYRDGSVFMDPITGQSSAIDMQGYGLPWWEGVILLGNRRYFVEGQGAFIEAFPEGGTWSERLDLQFIAGGWPYFTFRDRNGADYPCQVQNAF